MLKGTVSSVRPLLGCCPGACPWEFATATGAGSGRAAGGRSTAAGGALWSRTPAGLPGKTAGVGGAILVSPALWHALLLLLLPPRISQSVGVTRHRRAAWVAWVATSAIVGLQELMDRYAVVGKRPWSSFGLGGSRPFGRRTGVGLDAIWGATVCFVDGGEAVPRLGPDKLNEGKS